MSDQNSNQNSDQKLKCWRVSDLLEKKSCGQELTEEQVNFLVQCVTKNSIDDCQLGALLMAVKLRGMTEVETATLTNAMKGSGSVLSWPDEWITVDKHSTGGVGDKISIPLAPALAAVGLKVPMISGRGLEHTGGTLDKLESIPGYRVSLSVDEMTTALNDVGCCIVGQTCDIVPADRRMYAARDVTATVNSFPLIVSSIISKKAAESLKALVLDVKFGGGAFMQTQQMAQELATQLVGVGNHLGMKTTALLTHMDNPIGKTIGNALEIMESIDCLNGQGPQDLRELVIQLGGEVVCNGGVTMTISQGRELIQKALDDGSALQTFYNMLLIQGVEEEVARSLCNKKPDYSLLPTATSLTPVIAQTKGVIMSIDAMILAKASVGLGAGRTTVGAAINHAVGIVLLKTVGECVDEGEAWAEIHHDDILPKSTISDMQGAITIDKHQHPITTPSRVASRITSQS